MSSVICIIWDKVAEKNTAPLCFSNEACAVRYFKNYAAKINIADYTLKKIGVYDESTGTIKLDSDVVVLMDGENYGKES